MSDFDFSEPDRPQSPKSERSSGSSGLIFQGLGTVITVIGIFSTVAFLSMDTSVEVPGGFGGNNRVENLGLMQKQQVGIMVSLVSVIIGIGFLVTGSILAHVYKTPVLHSALMIFACIVGCFFVGYHLYKSARSWSDDLKREIKAIKDQQ